MDVLSNVSRLSIRRDPAPDVRVPLGGEVFWPVRLSIPLSPGTEAVVSWVVPAPLSRCSACGQIREVA